MRSLDLCEEFYRGASASSESVRNLDLCEEFIQVKCICMQWKCSLREKSVLVTEVKCMDCMEIIIACLVMAHELIYSLAHKYVAIIYFVTDGT